MSHTKQPSFKIIEEVVSKYIDWYNDQQSDDDYAPIIKVREFGVKQYLKSLEAKKESSNLDRRGR